MEESRAGNILLHSERQSCEKGRRTWKPKVLCILSAIFSVCSFVQNDGRTIFRYYRSVLWLTSAARVNKPYTKQMLDMFFLQWCWWRIRQTEKTHQCSIQADCTRKTQSSVFLDKRDFCEIMACFSSGLRSYWTRVSGWEYRGSQWEYPLQPQLSD